MDLLIALFVEGELEELLLVSQSILRRRIIRYRLFLLIHKVQVFAIRLSMEFCSPISKSKGTDLKIHLILLFRELDSTEQRLISKKLLLMMLSR